MNLLSSSLGFYQEPVPTIPKSSCSFVYLPHLGLPTSYQWQGIIRFAAVILCHQQGPTGKEACPCHTGCSQTGDIAAWWLHHNAVYWACCHLSMLHVLHSSLPGNFYDKKYQRLPKRGRVPHVQHIRHMCTITSLLVNVIMGCAHTLPGTLPDHPAWTPAAM